LHACRSTLEDPPFKSKKLVTLMSDLELGLNWEELKYEGFKQETLVEFLKEMEFSSLMKELGLYTQQPEQTPYRTISTEEEFDQLLQRMRTSQYVVIDTETDSLDPLSAHLVGISVALPDKSSHYVPVGHRRGRNLPLEKVLKGLKPILEDRTIKIVGQNLKYDYSIFMVNGITPNVPAFDTMIAAYLLNPDEKKFGLDELALKFLNYKMMSFDELVKSSSPLFSAVTFADVDVQDATRYSAEDADVTRRLYELLNVKLHEQGLTDVLEKIEMPLIVVLAEMELTGVYMNVSYLKDLSLKYTVKMDELSKQIFDLAKRCST
jgi:DNA polymerase I (EC 2.7.7.7)